MIVISYNKLGFRTNGGELFGGAGEIEYICTAITLRLAFRKEIILNG